MHFLVSANISSETRCLPQICHFFERKGRFLHYSQLFPANCSAGLFFAKCSERGVLGSILVRIRSSEAPPQVFCGTNASFTSEFCGTDGTLWNRLSQFSSALSKQLRDRFCWQGWNSCEYSKAGPRQTVFQVFHCAAKRCARLQRKGLCTSLFMHYSAFLFSFQSHYDGILTHGRN